MLDYLIVGAGLAGTALAETLLGKGRSVCVFEDSSGKASLVAAGLYNPVVLKRLNLTWEGGRLMDFSLPFYGELGRKLGSSYDRKLPILRRFASAQEQNAWFEAADRPGLGRFLRPGVLRNNNPGLEAPHGFGEVLETGCLDTSGLLIAYRSQLLADAMLRSESFDYEALELQPGKLVYMGLEARRIVFCEGFGLRANPYFNYLPLQGTKGELLTVRIPGLNETRIVKSGVFLIPLGRDLYRVGATYSHNDYSPEPTQGAREELILKLKRLLRQDFEVEGHSAGIRPTVPDRRPLVGRHPKYPGLYALNGMGSRGVLLAPFAADRLVRFIESGEALPPALDLDRYKTYYDKQPH